VTVGEDRAEREEDGREVRLYRENTRKAMEGSERKQRRPDHRRRRISVTKELDEELDSLQIRAFPHARLDEDVEGDEAQLLELSDGDGVAPGGGATARLRRWSSAPFLCQKLAVAEKN
jgi:hypothetical protein